MSLAQGWRINLLCGLLLLGIWNRADAQKYDYLWMVGLASSAIPDSQYIQASVSQFSYDADTVNVYRRFRPLDMSYSSISACNGMGLVQFYTNCMQINNTNDQAMPNGTGLNPGLAAMQNSGTAYAYQSYRAATIIPQPGSDSIYYLFHVAWVYDSLLLEGSVDSYFYYTVIDMRANGGLGDVIDKNHVLIGDYIIGEGGMCACKHGNGRDWWIFVPKLYTNCFYQFLLTPNGIDTLGLQCFGDTFKANTDRGSCCFSPDGSKYIWCNPYDSLHILDFDRCTGDLSNDRKIPVYDSLSMILQVPYYTGVSVSPNSKYLYVTSGTELWQYDLKASDISQSQVLIENLWQEVPYSSAMYSQLAPDGKIYINTIGADTFFHVINEPDSSSLECQFKKNGLRTPTYNFDAMPLYPNYRLGPVAGSICDTLRLDSLNNLTNVLYSESLLKVFPNPAGDFTLIDYGFTDWNKGPVSLEICNYLGQQVYRQQLSMYSGYQKIDVAAFAAGMYTAFIKRGNGVVATAQFVKE